MTARGAPAAVQAQQAPVGDDPINELFRSYGLPPDVEASLVHSVLRYVQDLMAAADALTERRCGATTHSASDKH